ncbi:MAG: hypothetical protein WCN85_12240 [Burkholderiales bacterium]
MLALQIGQRIELSRMANSQLILFSGNCAGEGLHLIEQPTGQGEPGKGIGRLPTQRLGLPIQLRLERNPLRRQAVCLLLDIADSGRSIMGRNKGRDVAGIGCGLKRSACLDQGALGPLTCDRQFGASDLEVAAHRQRAPRLRHGSARRHQGVDTGDRLAGRDAAVLRQGAGCLAGRRRQRAVDCPDRTPHQPLRRSRVIFQTGRRGAGNSKCVESADKLSKRLRRIEIGGACGQHGKRLPTVTQAIALATQGQAGLLDGLHPDSELGLGIIGKLRYIGEIAQFSSHRRAARHLRPEADQSLDLGESRSP